MAGEEEGGDQSSAKTAPVCASTNLSRGQSGGPIEPFGSTEDEREVTEHVPIDATIFKPYYKKRHFPCILENYLELSGLNEHR